MRRFVRGLLAAGFAALISVATAFVAPGVAQAKDERCRDITLPLTQPGLSIHGMLCQPSGSTKNVIQVLVPGATYNQTYWNFPYRPETYNFRLAMNRAGFTTLTLDRLGTGGSSRPPSATVTPELQANAVHQVIQAVRNGRFGQKFDKVILGGHSLGSAISELEASTYQDVDGVLLTGISHHLNVLTIPTTVNGFLRPAALDVQLAKRGYDPGYLTSVPGRRVKAFHEPGKPDPGVVKTDENTKDVLSAVEVPSAAAAFAGLDPQRSREIKVPVMLANGSHDRLMCGFRIDCTNADAMRRDEAPYFSPAARLHTYVLPNYGHSINLAPHTRDYQRAVAEWATSIT